MKNLSFFLQIAQFAEEVELADTEDLVREIISSIAETETLSKGPGYAPNAYFLQENEHLCLTTNGYVNANSYIASSSYNTSSPLLSVSGNGQVTGIQNANFSIADEVDTTVLSDDHTFQIEYISFPETVLKVQVRINQTPLIIQMPLVSEYSHLVFEFFSSRFCQKMFFM